MPEEAGIANRMSTLVQRSDYADATVAKNGVKIKLSDDQTTPPAFVGARTGAPDAGRGGIRLGRGTFEAKAQPIELLAVALGALYVDRPVINNTGLKGLYDIRLQWTADTSVNSIRFQA